MKTGVWPRREGIRLPPPSTSRPGPPSRLSAGGPPRVGRVSRERNGLVSGLSLRVGGGCDNGGVHTAHVMRPVQGKSGPGSPWRFRATGPPVSPVSMRGMPSLPTGGGWIYPPLGHPAPAATTLTPLNVRAPHPKSPKGGGVTPSRPLSVGSMRLTPSSEYLERRHCRITQVFVFFVFF